MWSSCAAVCVVDSLQGTENELEENETEPGEDPLWWEPGALGLGGVSPGGREREGERERELEREREG